MLSLRIVKTDADTASRPNKSLMLLALSIFFPACRDTVADTSVSLQHIWLFVQFLMPCFARYFFLRVSEALSSTSPLWIAGTSQPVPNSSCDPMSPRWCSLKPVPGTLIPMDRFQYPHEKMKMAICGGLWGYAHLHPIFRQNRFDRKEYTKASKLVILETTPVARVSSHLGSFLSNCAMGLYGGLEAGYHFFIILESH